VSFDPASRIYSVACKNGAGVSFPVSKIRELRKASDRDIEAGYITPSGDAIHWDNLDARYTVAGFVSRIFGTREWMQELGKIGGSKTSGAKAMAARTNGQKGGRPKNRPADAVAPKKSTRTYAKRKS